tara:strand:- start:3260 stop:4474 length:1215 start_codon:yes stop_codon:yes gene_type:complete
MTKKIFEELPARKHSPAAAPAAQEGGNKQSGEGGSEKKIRQAVYDIRYRARREGVDLRAAYAQYMQNSNLSAPEQAAVRAKLFGKDGGGDKKESYDSMMSDSATGTVANALFKVFVEKVEKEPIQEDEGAERKYKVRVGDPKSGKSYVRYANRSKITELRSKGLKVEMTEHGEPYEGERKKGGKMDPVAKNPQKRDGDVNNDGKKDGTDKYIYARRDAINAAIAKKNAMKEDFLVDGTTSTEGQGTMVPDGKVNNYSGKNPVVTVNPDSKVDGAGSKNLRAHREVEMSASQRRLMEMIAKKNQTSVAEEQGMNCGCGQNPCVTYGEGKEEVCPKCKKCPCECGHADREKRTYRELLKNKLRAMGIKNPMMLGAPDDGETVMKIMTSSNAKMTSEGYGSKKKKKK